MRHSFEVAEALIDLRVIQLVDALGSELLDVERRHHGSVDHRSTQRLIVDLFLAREISHESAGECVTCTRGIENGLERIRGRREIIVFCEKRRTVFSALDDDGFQAEVHDLSSGFMDVRLIGQLSRFGVIDDNAVDDLDRFDKLILC